MSAFSETKDSPKSNHDFLLFKKDKDKHDKLPKPSSPDVLVVEVEFKCTFALLEGIAITSRLTFNCSISNLPT